MKSLSKLSCHVATYQPRLNVPISKTNSCILIAYQMKPSPFRPARSWCLLEYESLTIRLIFLRALRCLYRYSLCTVCYATEHYLYTLSMKCCQANVYVVFARRFRKGGEVAWWGWRGGHPCACAPSGARAPRPPPAPPPPSRCVHVRTMRNTRIAH